MALYFNVKVSDLINNDDTVQLVLKKNDLSAKVNLVVSWIVIIFDSVFAILSFLPCVTVRYYDYAAGYEPGSSPKISTRIDTPIGLTLKNNNPIVLIGLILLFVNIGLSLASVKWKNNVWIKLVNYVLFVINIFIIFFSIVFVVSYSTGYGYDY